MSLFRTNKGSGSFIATNWLAINTRAPNGTNKGSVQSPVWCYNNVVYQRNYQLIPESNTIDTPLATIKTQNNVISVTLKIPAIATGFDQTNDVIYPVGTVLTMSNVTAATTGIYTCAFLVEAK